MKKILIVDDFEGNRELLADILEEFYEVDTAANGKEAISLIETKDDYNLMLLDLMMPVVDGFSVLEFMQDRIKNDKFPIIIISGDSGAETEGRCLDYGVADFVAKPFKEKVILKRIENILSLREYQSGLENEIEKKNKTLEMQNRQLRQQARLLEETNANIIDILGNVVESRNLESGTHIKRVKGFTKILGIQLMKDYPEYGLSPERVELISKAAALHDIGKIAIPDNILLKPGKLTKEEFEYMKSHTTRGCDILDSIEGIWDEDYRKTSYEICRYHHEKFDGRGYPEGLKGDDIPLSAQLVSVADCYDALTTERIYKKAFSKEQAFQMIITGECGMFSPKLLESFRNARLLFEEYVHEGNSI